MENSAKKRYIIGDKVYTPEKSVLLCHYDGILYTEDLYFSENSVFFCLYESILADSSISVFSHEKAVDFMNRHPAGINESGYIQVFGKPDKG